MAAVWREADQIDLFESAWNFDHFYPIHVPDTSGPCLEGWTTLAGLAALTERIRVGCMVTGVVYRHPAVLANMAAALDVMSGGRLELGIGAAWNTEECDAYGIELGTLTERFDRFDEACEVIVGLLTNETTTFDGRYYQLRDARNEPKGPQRPHPPICIGGTGEKRTIPAVARWAQHWNYPGDRARFARKRDVLRAECEAVGRDPDEIQISMQPWVDLDDMGKAGAEVAELDALGVDLAVFYLPPPHRPEVVVRLAEALAAA